MTFQNLPPTGRRRANLCKRQGLNPGRLLRMEFPYRPGLFAANLRACFTVVPKVPFHAAYERGFASLGEGADGFRDEVQGA